MNWAETIINFIQDEQLGPYKFKNKKDSFVIEINEPAEWGTGDTKFRCGFTLKEIDGEQQPVFNAFKASALLGEEYKGHFYKFVKIVKDFDSILDAKFFVLRTYGSVKDYFKHPEKSTIKDTETKKTKIAIPDYFEKFDTKKHKEYYEYLLSRNIKEQRIQSTKIFINQRDKYVVFPIYEFGELIGYIQRSIEKNSILPYIKIFKHDSFPIWNFDEVVQKQIAILFEGIFDAIHVKNGLALLGPGYERQMKKIIECAFNKIVIVLDNDAVGRESKIRWAKYLYERDQNVFIYDYSKIKFKDFGMIAEKSTIDFTDRLYPWNYKTEIQMKMKMII